MAGSPPPPDLPPIAEQPAFSADAGFAPSPAGPSLCGFGFPVFSFNLSFRIPLPDFNFPPTFNFFVQLNCDLSDPIDAEFGFGGGRQQNIVPDEDEEFR